MTCYSLATCSYQLLNIASTVSLNMFGSHLFEDNNPTRLYKPLITSVATKALSLIPYYLSHEVQKNFGHPTSEAAYPGLFALASGYASKRVSASFPSLQANTITTVFSIATSFSEVYLQKDLGNGSFCNLQNFNATVIDRPADIGDSLLATVAASSFLGSFVLFQSVHQIIVDKAAGSNNLKWGDFILGLAFTVGPRALTKFLNHYYQSIYTFIQTGSTEIPVFAGMLTGAVRSQTDNTALKIFLSKKVIFLTGLPLKILAMDYCTNKSTEETDKSKNSHFSF